MTRNCHANSVKDSGHDTGTSRPARRAGAARARHAGRTVAPARTDLARLRRARSARRRRPALSCCADAPAATARRSISARRPLRARSSNSRPASAALAIFSAATQSRRGSPPFSTRCGSARTDGPRSKPQALAPIAARLAAERAQTAAKTAATRVNFFTLVRGEDGGVTAFAFADPVARVAGDFSRRAARDGSAGRRSSTRARRSRRRRRCGRAAAAALLTLADFETPLWIAPSLAGTEVAAYLKFHTGARARRRARTRRLRAGRTPTARRARASLLARNGGLSRPLDHVDPAGRGASLARRAAAPRRPRRRGASASCGVAPLPADFVDAMAGEPRGAFRSGSI